MGCLSRGLDGTSSKQLRKLNFVKPFRRKVSKTTFLDRNLQNWNKIWFSPKRFDEIEFSQLFWAGAKSKRPSLNSLITLLKRTNYVTEMECVGSPNQQTPNLETGGGTHGGQTMNGREEASPIRFMLDNQVANKSDLQAASCSLLQGPSLLLSKCLMEIMGQEKVKGRRLFLCWGGWSRGGFESTPTTDENIVWR